MATSGLRMAAICGTVLLVVLLSTAGQPAMAAYDVARHQQGKGGNVLQCPTPVTSCRSDCADACDATAQLMCNLLCGVTPTLLGGVDQSCVNQFFTPCQVVCKNLCEPLPLPGNP